MELNSIKEIVEDFRQGKMVIIMDDENRENEGDLLMAAESVTPDAINFMARYGRGLICVALTPDRCDQLELPLITRQQFPDELAIDEQISHKCEAVGADAFLSKPRYEELLVHIDALVL